MGFFGGDNEPDNRANDLIEQQMRENDIEIEQKRRSLVQTRMEVIKAQGAQQWETPPNFSGVQPAPTTKTGYSGNGGGWGAMISEGQRMNGVAGKPNIGKQ